MQAVMHVTTTVQRGHKVEIVVPEFSEGDKVKVDISLVAPEAADAPKFDSVLDFLDSLPPGPRTFPTWEEYEKHFQEERNSWDR